MILTRKMDSTSIKNFLKQNFRKFDRIQISIEGRYDIFLQRCNNGFQAIESGMDDDEVFHYKDYNGLVSYIQAQFIFLSFVEGMRERKEVLTQL